MFSLVSGSSVGEGNQETPGPPLDNSGKRTLALTGDLKNFSGLNLEATGDRLVRRWVSSSRGESKLGLPLYRRIRLGCFLMPASRLFRFAQSLRNFLEVFGSLRQARQVALGNGVPSILAKPFSRA